MATNIHQVFDETEYLRRRVKDGITRLEAIDLIMNLLITIVSYLVTEHNKKNN